MKRTFLFFLLIPVIFISCEQTFVPGDPLPSWNDGDTKQSIINYVEKVSDKNSDSYIEPVDRIATFDNDGTLWTEQPTYFQFYFVVDRLRKLAEMNPDIANDTLVRALLDQGHEAIFTFSGEGITRVIVMASTGMNTDEYADIVEEWISTTKHPETGMYFTDMIYQPMLELLQYLRDNEFKTFIVSGGGIEFMRPWTMETYGIPTHQVIGSTMAIEWEMTDDGPVLNRMPEMSFFNDKTNKPIAINRCIGKKPVFAAGNSDGDLAMLQWSYSNALPSFQLYVHHTDAEREWAYDRDSHIGRLDKGLDVAAENGWTVVDMKSDWKVIWPEE
ncbi:MAG: HAD family hydrolase [Bacteroidales bacterium]|jgi:phosphoserine phosphatase|nr:HAD family hydrolase [Bacteroidales bacterium]